MLDAMFRDDAREHWLEDLVVGTQLDGHNTEQRHRLEAKILEEIVSFTGNGRERFAYRVLIQDAHKCVHDAGGKVRHPKEHRK
jgi:hypothetical protein